MVPPWGCRADGGVPSNTPLSGRTRRYRGRQLLLGGSSVSRRAAEPTASPLSRRAPAGAPTAPPGATALGNGGARRELQLPAPPAAAALGVRMRPARTPFPGRPAERVAPAPLPQGRDALAVTQRGDAKKCAPSRTIAAAAGCAGPTAGAGGGDGTAGQRSGTGAGVGGTRRRGFPGASPGRASWRPRPPRRVGAGAAARGVEGGASGARGRLRVRPRARGRPRGGGPGGPGPAWPGLFPPSRPVPPGGTGPAPPRPARPAPCADSSFCAGPARARGEISGSALPHSGLC